MNHRLSIDRFEGGERGEIAVLLTDDGRAISIPRDLLPKGSKSDDVLSMTLRRDPSATAEVARQARAIRDDLAKTDPGGDIRL